MKHSMLGAACAFQKFHVKDVKIINLVGHNFF